MWHRARDLRYLLWGLPAMLLAAWGLQSLLLESAGDAGSGVRLEAELIEVTGQPGDIIGLEVRPMLAGGAGAALMGTVKAKGGSVVFDPALPLVPGQVYQVRWRDAVGQVRTFAAICPGAVAAAPTVSLRPAGVPLPANALKLYLHFSQPMEQGVFLDRLRLVDAAGQEVPGPFRETELWSPDGQRLTVWFHPGRQKTGVNLNEEEGPVLEEGKAYALRVDGGWRSAAGVPLGKEVSFPFTVGVADHAMPQPARWWLALPRTGSRDPLVITLDEPLDTAMLAGALTLYHESSRAPVPARVEVAASGLEWRAVPEAPWQSGTYEVRPDLLLEDLAGNSLTKPFEVDVLASPKAMDAALCTQRFKLP